MNYFEQTVYSITTKTCHSCVQTLFTGKKGEGAKMGTFEKLEGHSPPDLPPGSAATAHSYTLPKIFHALLF